MTMQGMTRWLKPAALGVLLWASLAGPARAADFYLKAAAMTKTMPNAGPAITMWGYVLCDATFTPLAGQVVQVPGPRLVVPPGDTTLNIHLLDGLPSAGSETSNTSLVIPELPATMVPTWTDGTTGPRTSTTQRVRSFTQEVAPGGSVTYTWTSLRPGTFLYESGTHPSVQVQMGLYGCVTIDAAAGPPAQAYPGVSYDNEAVLVFSEVDPAIHAAVAAGTYGTAPYTSTINYTPKYFFINGAPYPDTLAAPIFTKPFVLGQHILLRFLNPGEETHVPVLQDLYMTVVAQDGYPLPYPRTEYSLILEAGKTFDAIVTPTTSGLHGLFDRRLRLTNNMASNGGMLTYLTDNGAAGGCPGTVGSTLKLSKSGGQILFTWGNIALASSYIVYQSNVASLAPFTQQDTLNPTAPADGTTGATMPMPPDNLVFFLIAGDNLAGGGCVGPQR